MGGGTPLSVIFFVVVKNRPKTEFLGLVFRKKSVRYGGTFLADELRE